MASIQTTYMTSGDKVRFIVSIAVGDPIEYWKVLVSAKQDHGQGQTGGDYPNFVEKIVGTNNTTFYRARSSLYFADDYVAELRLPGIDGTVDFDRFTIPGSITCQPTQGQKYCNSNTTRCDWNQSRCNYDCYSCPSGQVCSNGDCITPTAPNKINYTTFAKDNGYGGAVEFSSCTVDSSVATGHIKIMNQVTINTPGTYKIRNTYKINGAAWDFDGTKYFVAGTYWTSMDTGVNYEAGNTYEIVGSWFI